MQNHELKFVRENYYYGFWFLVRVLMWFHQESQVYLANKNQLLSKTKRNHDMTRSKFPQEISTKCFIESYKIIIIDELNRNRN